MTQPEDILEFWFDGVDEAGICGPESCLSRWFGVDPALDREMRERFGGAVESALAGGWASWTDVPRTRVALVILLDQFTRNLHRGESRAYAGDPRALDLASEAVGLGVDSSLRPIERYFLYLPFEHAEDLSTQNASIRLYEALTTSVPNDPPSLVAGALDWALRHQVVIERFGRFPSRNAALGRISTPEELAFLEEVPSGF